MHVIYASILFNKALASQCARYCVGYLGSNNSCAMGGPRLRQLGAEAREYFALPDIKILNTTAEVQE